MSSADHVVPSPAARVLRSSPALVAVLLLTSLLSLPAAAQAVGTLRGIVIDANGAPVPGATVTVAGGGPPVSTDRGGLFTMKLKPGSYQVTAARKGYAPESLKGVEIRAGGVKDVSLLLMPAR